MVVSVVDTEKADNIIVLGKIVGPYALLGAVKIFPYADDPLSWAKLKRWFVGQSFDSLEQVQELSPKKGKLHDGMLVVQFAGVDDRDGAEGLKGALVAAYRSDLPEPEDNSFYWNDLIGMSVVNQDEIVLGAVVGLIETPANDVLRVCPEGKPVSDERLIPFIESAVKHVDQQARCITVDWGADW